MQEKIQEIYHQIDTFSVLDRSSFEEFKRLFTAKKGTIATLFDELKLLDKEKKAIVGKKLNDLKQYALNKEKFYEQKFESSITHQHIDVGLEGSFFWEGNRHPIQISLHKIIHIFEQMGFQIAVGPEIEDDWHNFTALNFPPNHPAREMQDTFFLEDTQYLLRTHTSSVQVRLMEQGRLPIRAIMPGKVYRNEEITARSHCFFHQVEGLVIDKSISYADLKQCLELFVKKLFGEHARIRLRASFFPFTEISAEVDVSCFLCNGNGCNVCKHSGWVEILGCGMVDPNVLINCHIDPEQYSGFAFGLGIERITMLLNKINDIRLMDQNDIRFLQQFNPVNF